MIPLELMLGVILLIGFLIKEKIDIAKADWYARSHVNRNGKKLK